MTMSRLKCTVSERPIMININYPNSCICCSRRGSSTIHNLFRFCPALIYANCSHPLKRSNIKHTHPPGSNGVRTQSSVFVTFRHVIQLMPSLD